VWSALPADYRRLAVAPILRNTVSTTAKRLRLLETLALDVLLLALAVA
jgi:hypothetical protein